VPKQQLLDHVPQFIEGVRGLRRISASATIIHSHYWLSGVAAEALAESLGSCPNDPDVPYSRRNEEPGGTVEKTNVKAPKRIAAEKRLVSRADRIVVSRWPSKRSFGSCTRQTTASWRSSRRG
jgi:hypothetical protein